MKRKSEAAVQNDIRLEADRRGDILWRNNSGACYDDGGRLIRYGLGNDSADINKLRKSPDLVGIRPTLITQEMVGYMIGRFIGVECKRGGWRMSPSDEHAEAQQNFGNQIIEKGGIFQFAADVTEVYR